MRKIFLSLILASSLYASPEGMKVVSGSAVLSSNENETNIQTGERTIINWDKFSIAKDELTRFSQPSSFSTVLNRVTGKEMSKILGKLESNGKVYLLNPNGVIIGKDAYINAASFIASTYDVLDSDFLKNEDLWFSGESNEKIVNLGTIKAFDGDVILIGRSIQNEGSITAEKGAVAIGAGKEILLKPLDKERIYIKPQMEKESGREKDGETGIENSGEIKAVSSYLKADGNLYSLAIKNSGSIDALSFQEKGGEIFLIAENSTLENSGKLKAKKENRGGEVRLFGKNVGLLGNARIDVSHEKDGGVVLVGGDFQGKNQDIKNANAIFMSKEANINASSLNNGDGGKVILWGNDVTRFYGNILAEGGKEKGNGGLVEVSGAFLDFKGLVSTTALNGKVGTLLLDPNVLTILPPPSVSNPPFPLGATIYAPPGPSAVLNSVDLENNLNLNSVKITNQGSTLDTISVEALVTWGSSNTLTIEWLGGEVFINSATINSGFDAIGGGKIIIVTGDLFIGKNTSTTNSIIRSSSDVTIDASLSIVAGTNGASGITAGGTVKGLVEGLYMESGETVSGTAFIDTNALDIDLGSQDITMVARPSVLGGFCGITTAGDLTIKNVSNIKMDSVGDGGVGIHSQAGGNVKINDLAAKGSGGVFLNNNPGVHNAFAEIGTDNNGTVSCFFSGDSIINASTTPFIYSVNINSTNGVSPSAGKITFYGHNLSIIDGSVETSGILASETGDIELHLNTLSIVETRNLGFCGIQTSSFLGTGNISGSINTIQITSGGGTAFIQANAGTVNLDNLNGTTTLSAPLAVGTASINASGNVTISNLNSLEMIPTNSDTFITSTSGNILLNSAAAKGNFIKINDAGAPHSAYIATTISGNVECYFSGPTASIIKGGNGGNCGVFTGYNAGGTGGNITFQSADLNISAGLNGNTGIFSGFKNAAFSGTGDITFNTANLIITSPLASTALSSIRSAVNITNSSASSISIVSGDGVASIFAGGSLTINSCGNISLTANGTADSFIGSVGNLSLLLANSITTNSNLGRTYIETTGGGNILINDSSAKGSGGITLNATPASNNFASFIATENSGDIECNFLGSSSINGGAALNAFSGIITGLTSGGGNITIENGALVLKGGTGQDSFATIRASGTGSISFPIVGDIDITAGNVASGSYASIETLSGSIFINALLARGHLNMTAKTPNNSFAVVRVNTAGIIAGSFSSLSTFQAGAGAVSVAGIYNQSGDIFLSFHDLNMTGGNGGNNNNAAIETINNGNITISSDGNIVLQGGSSNLCQSRILTHLNGIITISGNNSITLRGGSAFGCQAVINSFGGGVNIGSSSVKNNQLILIGGSFDDSSALVQTEANGGDINIFSKQISLTGGSAFSCPAVIQTQFAGSIAITCDGLLSLQGGTASTTFAIIQTGASNATIDIFAGEVFLNSSYTNFDSAAAIRLFDPTSFVKVITNGGANSAGDISIIANAAPAFISDAVLIQASHDLIINSINSDAYILTTSSSPFFTPTIQVGNELTMNGSPNTANVAKITPVGAATSINITVGDDARLIAPIGSSFISGYNNINMFTGDVLSIQSGSLGSAFIDSSGNANFSLDSLDITSFLVSARITAALNLNILVYDNNMTLTSTVNANAFVQGGNTSIDVNGNLIMSSLGSGVASIQSTDYSLFNVGRDISLSGNGSNITKTGASPFVVTAGDSIFVNDSSFFQNASGPFTILAGQDIQINGGRIENLSGDDLTLVVDNNFPVSPEIGDGHFDIAAGSILRTAPGGKLRIFTAAREFNSIESPLNGVAFVPGTAFEDSNFEVWGVYYPSSFFGGPGFTIFYKNIGDISNILLSAVDFAASELFFRLNNMIPDLFILDYFEKFIERSKYFFVDDERDSLVTRERFLLKLLRE